MGINYATSRDTNSGRAAVRRSTNVQPTGGVYRRPGMAYVDGVPGDGRLVAFEQSTEDLFLLFFRDLEAANMRGVGH